MKKSLSLVTLILILFSQNYKSREYVCFYMMNVEIQNTMEENVRQQNLRNGSAQNFALEAVNKSEFNKMNTTTQKIRSRLSSVGLLLQSIPYGWNITKYIEGTIEYQTKIFEELQDAPPFVIVVIPQQLSFAKHLQQNSLLLYGIIASYGAINQMESKERKILLDFAEAEFKQLYYEAINMHTQIRTTKNAFRWKKQMLIASIKEDKAMFDDIIKQF